MGKKKTDASTTKKRSTKKEKTPEPAPVIEKTAGKATTATSSARTTRSEPRSHYRLYLDRVCKSIDVRRLHHDAVEVVDGALINTLDALGAIYRTLLSGGTKKFSRKTATLAFLEFCNQRGVSDEVRDGAIARAAAALAALTPPETQ